MEKIKLDIYDLITELDDIHETSGEIIASIDCKIEKDRVEVQKKLENEIAYHRAMAVENGVIIYDAMTNKMFSTEMNNKFNKAELARLK